MKLSDVGVRKAKLKIKPYKMADGGGLFLLVQPSGSKYWRLAYRFEGKQKILAFGVYPDVSLVQARENRDAARKLLATGIDPGENRKAKKKTRWRRSQRETKPKQVHSRWPLFLMRQLRSIQRRNPLILPPLEATFQS